MICLWSDVIVRTVLPVTPFQRNEDSRIIEVGVIKDFSVKLPKVQYMNKKCKSYFPHPKPFF